MTTVTTSSKSTPAPANNARELKQIESSYLHELKLTRAEKAEQKGTPKQLERQTARERRQAGRKITAKRAASAASQQVEAIKRAPAASAHPTPAGQRPVDANNRSKERADERLCDKNSTPTTSTLRQDPSRQLLVDSRSILVNKPRLKRFWERRIEMDVRLQRFKQQQQQRALPKDKHEQFEAEMAQEKPQVDANNNAFEAEAERLDEAKSKPEVEASHSKGEEVPKQQDERQLIEFQPQESLDANNNNSAGGQPMSIDPTLCRAAPTDHQDEDEQDGGLELEEQCANEEFSSTSSSFGPVSISVPRGHFDELKEDEYEDKLGGLQNGQQTSDKEQRRQLNCLMSCVEGSAGSKSQREQTRNRAASNSANSDEDEQNLSTCSGSVLTVISNSNNRSGEQAAATTPPPTPTTDCHHQTHDDCEAAAQTPATNEDNGRPIGLDDHQSIELGCKPNEDDLDEAESGSNIGVAFESLQFEDEIKSARNERVDEQLLMGSPGRQSAQEKLSPAAEIARGAESNNCTANSNNQSNKFNLERVKLACNFITGAISDAARQVDNQFRLNGLASAATTAAANNDKPTKELAASELHEKQKSHPRAATSAAKGPSTNRQNGFASGADEREHELDGAAESERLLHNGAKLAHPEAQQEPDEEPDDELGQQDELDELNDEERQLDELPQLKADLSSIFDANVKREIERFEANSMLRCRSLAAKSGGPNGQLTEWKIAEEIRHFNEREEELKRRMLAAGGQRRKQQVASGQQHQPGPMKPLQELESVVRCGKLFHIPKYSQVVASATLGRQQFVDYSGGNARAEYRTARPALKLTSSATNGGFEAESRNESSAQASCRHQQATTISMHKFVSSGGKRFVQRAPTSSASSTVSSGYSCDASDSSATSFRQATTNEQQRKRQLAKSMTNLSTQAPPEADYRAVDSLKCREVPNVEAGLARRTIESFSRLHCGRARDLSSAVSSSAVHRAEPVGGQRIHQPSQVVRQQPAPSSAEQKIQAELRDIRCREAELEHQRRRQQKRKLHAQRQQASHLDRKALVEPEDSTREGETRAQSPAFEEAEATDSLQSIETTNAAEMDQNSSSDSLYPIKETIESFRKLATGSSEAQINTAECNSNGKSLPINRVICRR